MGEIIKVEIPEEIYAKLKDFLYLNRDYRLDDFITLAILEALEKRSANEEVDLLDQQLAVILGDYDKVISVQEARKMLDNRIPPDEKLSDLVIKMREEF